MTVFDAVAGAMAHFQRAMMIDVAQEAKAMRDAEMEAEIEDFIEGFKQPTYRGMRINGSACTRLRSLHQSHKRRPAPAFATPEPRRHVAQNQRPTLFPHHQRQRHVDDLTAAAQLQPARAHLVETPR